MPKRSALLIAVKSTAFMQRAAMYEITIPMSIGKILTIPLPKILQMMTVARAMKAKSQFSEQLEMALGARVRPMEMMMGPVTTGGKKRIIFFTPKAAIRPESTRYTNPATTTPPQA